MFAKIKQLLGIGLFARPLKKDGPFERAAAEVAAMEGKDRAKWEEREAHWRARSRAIQGHRAWNEDPAGTPHFDERTTKPEEAQNEEDSSDHNGHGHSRVRGAPSELQVRRPLNAGRTVCDRVLGLIRGPGRLF